MLLLTNPNDPLGVIYKPSVIVNAISWARRNHVHTIVDEIFALTVHNVRDMILPISIILVLDFSHSHFNRLHLQCSLATILIDSIQ